MATEKTDSPDAASDVDAAERSTATVLDQLGGVSGLISSTIPVIEDADLSGVADGTRVRIEPWQPVPRD